MDGDESLTIGLVAHHVFCPRRAWLEAVGERTDSAQIAVGSLAHRTTDDPSTGREGVLRGVDVASERLGIVGQCDTVETNPDGSVTVVEFRVPVADSAVVGAFNNGELSLSDFTNALGITTLRPSGKRSLIAAYERRVMSTFRHPIFDYEVTWRQEDSLLICDLGPANADVSGLVTVLGRSLLPAEEGRFIV
jgi:hypothetical protein